MNGIPDEGLIVGLRESKGQLQVTVEFADPQPVDAPQGATSKRLDLRASCIRSTWREA